ncbi:DUF5681 domain-containing protein [Altererythrobacter arenosus]|uniref:DUF5681 domain-containing protein n=1 Tax=Altererythrobacter arenosus TaxID=3032592 RepID=A0ABY8G0M6_9SPHN|nr:DUF5681 domain-containing protein [Altererythrobacter sp. CAU 1644]WFL77809.1 DUF5681 domain-containing protein [Altererythrobacter sp. CAU 1644]
MSGAKQQVGYQQPPSSTRFRKGQSGNPRGRPKNRRREIPYDTVLGQMVTIREDGRERRVTAAEAFLLQLTQKGLAGDSAATRASLDAIEAARATRYGNMSGPSKIIRFAIDSGADAIIGKLGIAFHKYPADEARTRWELNPWIVEAALDRLGDRQLSETDQSEVWGATRTPQKVAWPEWWRHFGG